MPDGSVPPVSVGDLHRAIATGELVLYYQPRIALSDLKITGAEALVRWVDGQSGRVIAPGLFLPLAEQHELTTTITLRTFELLIKDARRIHAEVGPITLSYNLSAHDLKHFDVVEAITEATTRRRIDPKLLELELTETSQFTNNSNAARRLKALGKAGISLAMDDYGTGHSNLESLRHLPVRTIKLDQGVVKNIWCCTKARSIAWQTPRIARASGLVTVAEGVEDQATLEFLRDAGFDEAQGYYMARPMPLDAFIDFCRTQWQPEGPERHGADLVMAIESHLAWRQIMLQLVPLRSPLRQRISKLEMLKALSDWYEDLHQKFQNHGRDGRLTLLYMRLRNLCMHIMDGDLIQPLRQRHDLQTSLQACSSELVMLVLDFEASLSSGLPTPDAVFGHGQRLLRRPVTS